MFQFVTLALAVLLVQNPSLDSSSPKERLDAIELLSQRSRVENVAPLGEALKMEPRSDVRAAIVAGLARIGAREALPLLTMSLLSDLDKDVRLQTIESLQLFYIPVDNPGRIQTVFNKVKSVFAVPQRPVVPNGASVDSTVNDALGEAMQRDSNQEVRAAAARALGSLKARDRVAVMIATLQSPQNQEHPEVRLEIAESLGIIGDPAAGPALERAAHDNDRGISQAAIVSVGMVGYKEARPAIENIFRTDRSAESRKRALEALALMRDPGTAPLFESLLGHADDYYRELAAEGLGRFSHDPGVLKSRYETEKKANVRNALAFALVAADQDQYFNDLANALDSRQGYQAEAYILELGKFEGKLPELHRYLRSSSATIRAKMVRILGDIGDESSRPLVEEMTKDKNSDVAGAAIVALRKLTPA